MIEAFYFFTLARRGLLLSSLLIASCCALWAQPDGPMGQPPNGPPPEGMQMEQQRGPSVERELKQLTQLLTLTTAQQEQVKTILTDRRQQVLALAKPPAQGSKSDADASEQQMPSRETMEALRAAIKATRESADAKIAALLSDDQKTRFAAFQAKREKSATRQQESEEMPPPPPDGGDGPPPDGGGGPPGAGGPGGGPPGV